MEWTKIKPTHILFTSYTSQQRGDLLTMLCLTAQLERLPIRAEMVQHIHHKGLRSLEDALKAHSTTLQEVLNKVVEDAQEVQRKRGLTASRQTIYRKKEKENNALCNATEKIREDKIREDKKKRGRFSPPSLKDLTEFINEKGYSVNATTFFNHYESNGWMVGKNKMKSWQAAIANWNSRDKDDKKPVAPKQKNPSYITEMQKDYKERIGVK